MSRSQINIQVWNKMAKGILIVESKAASIGKTFYIQKIIQRQMLIGLYFPLSGKITFQTLIKRLKVLNYVTNTALILQIHNIVNKKQFDKILFQIIYFRCIYNYQFLCLKNFKKIFIQIQNNADNNIRDFDSLNLLNNNNQNYKFIDLPNEKDIYINNNDIKSYFVFQYLSLLNNKQIDQVWLTYEDFIYNFQKYRNNISRLKIETLLNKYFFQQFSKNGQSPSFIHYKFFIQLLCEAFIAFGNSIFMEKQNIYQYKQQIKAFQSFRSQFINIILNNSIQILKRSFQESKFVQKLKNHPLLILSNMDNITYSFIYRQTNNVPHIIKIFILSQYIVDTNKLNNTYYVNKTFENHCYFKKENSQVQKYIIEYLTNISGKPVIKDQKYSLTIDNFIKMCYIILRMKVYMPIIIMGQTGVGKTSLIKFLVQNVFQQKLLYFILNEGDNFQTLTSYIKIIQQTKRNFSKQRIWVFFDQFNTTQQLGYLKDLIINRRYLGKQVSDQIVFIASCNPYKIKKNQHIYGYCKKLRKNKIASHVYTVFHPPLSIIQVMWNFGKLIKDEIKNYIKTILKIKYRLKQVQIIILQTYQKLKKNINDICLNIRELVLFNQLYEWFINNIPTKKSNSANYPNQFNPIQNYQILIQQRAIILTLYLCYYVKFPTYQSRKQYIIFVQSIMKYQKDYIWNVITNQHIDLLSRMNKQNNLAFNLALSQNVFCAFVCLMKKIPMLIVGKPGCSKSLAIKLLQINFQDNNWSQKYINSFQKVVFHHFQDHQSNTQENILKLFSKALEVENNQKLISAVFFDIIGWDQMSVHNSLNVLHNQIQLIRNKISFIGISNSQLDASQMSRFLFVYRPDPDKDELIDSIKKIFQINGINVNNFQKIIQKICQSYYLFVEQWKNNFQCMHHDLFGMRDFYRFIKYICKRIIKQKATYYEKQKIYYIIKRGIQRNFDGSSNSILIFISYLQKLIQDLFFKQKSLYRTLQLIQENLSENDSSYLLIIVKEDGLIYFIQKILQQKGNTVIIQGSSFIQDQHKNQYNIMIISNIITYVGKGYIIILKDVNNYILNCLYNLLNKQFICKDNKNYCIIELDNNNQSIYVHPNFKCIVYVTQQKLIDINASFLQRFQKHYLTLQDFLTNKHKKIVKQILQWIQNLFSEYFKQPKKTLCRYHFILNMNEEVICQLVIKCQKQQPIQDDCKRLCKKYLIFNSTLDFQLYFQQQFINLQQKQLINKIIKQKKEFDMKSQKFLIIWTYDQCFQQKCFWDCNVHFIILEYLRTYKQLKQNILNFFQSNKQQCVIRINFKKESNHISQIIFIIKQIQCKQKRFKLIICLSRQQLTNHKQIISINYLNEFKQIFLQNITALKTDFCSIPKNMFDIINCKIVKIKKILYLIYQQIIGKFNFFYKDQRKYQLLPHFISIIKNLQNKSLFLQLFQTYFLNCLKNKQLNREYIKNWPDQILNNFQYSKMCRSTFDTFQQIIIDQVKQGLISFLLFIIQKNIIYSFDLQSTIPILFNLYKNIDWVNIIQNIKGQNYNNLFIKLIKYNLPKKFYKINKQFKSNIILLDTPLIFPLIKYQIDFIFKKNIENVQQNIEDIQNNSYQDICKQFNEIQRNIYENKQQIGALYNFNIKQSFQNKTILLKKNLLGNISQNFIQIIQKNKNLKQIYKRDVMLYYFQKNIKCNFFSSSILIKKFQQFNKDQPNLYQFLYRLIKSNNLFNQLSKLIDFIDQLIQDQIKKLNIIKKFIPQGTNLLFQGQVQFTKQLFLNYQNTFAIKKTNILLFNSFNNFYIFIIKSFYILMNLSAEYKIKIPKLIILYKSLIYNIQLAQPIQYYQILNQYSQFSSFSFSQLVYFLQKIRPKVQCQKYISIFQTTVLFILWYEQICQGYIDQIEFFKDLLILLINQDLYFCQYSHTLLSQIFNLQYQNNQQIIQKFTFQKIKQNIILFQLNKSIQKDNYNNNLSFVLLNCFKFQYNKKLLQQFIDQNILTFKNFLLKYSIQYSQLTCIQKIIIFSFIKNFIQIYVQTKIIQKNQSQNIKVIDNILNGKIFFELINKIDKYYELITNIRLFILKILRKKQGNFKKLKNQILTNKFNLNFLWIQQFQHLFNVIIDQQQYILYPPIVSQQSNIIYQQLYRFTYSNNFQNLKIISKIIEQCRNNFLFKYEFLNFFVFQIYLGNRVNQKCKEKIKNYIITNQNTIKQVFKPFAYEYLLFLMNQQLNQFLNIQKSQKSQVIISNLIIFNIINWTISSVNNISPVTDMFFQNGKFRENIAQYAQNNFYLCGPQNPFVSCSQNIKSTLTKNLGIFICSSQCDYIYSIDGCGWPKHPSICPYCKKQISGTEHVLTRWKQGARRIGTNLLYKKGRFTRRYSFSNTTQNQFHVWDGSQIQKFQIYWQTLKIYIDYQTTRIRKKKQIKIAQNIIKVTGFSNLKYPNSRVSNLTSKLFHILIKSILFLASNLGWIQQIQLQQLLKQKICTKELYLQLLNDISWIKQMLQIQDSQAWIFGIYKKIFLITGNFDKFCDQHYEKQINYRIKFKKQNMIKGINHPLFRRCIDNMFQEGVIWNYQKHTNYGCQQAWNRDYLQKLCDQELLKVCSGNQKINFIKENLKRKGKVNFQFDDILLQKKIDNKYKLCRIFRIGVQPSIHHMQRQFGIYIKQHYPLLYQTLQNISQFKKLQKFTKITIFLKELVPLVDFKISRQQSKNVTIIDFINNLKQQKNLKINLCNLLDQFLEAWNTINLGSIQYMCKTLGTISPYCKQTQLIKFLPDSLKNISQTQNNLQGKIILGILHLFANQQNAMINKMQACKKNISNMQYLKIYDNHQIIPQKINKTDILYLTENQLQQIIHKFANSSQIYGQTFPVYYFQGIQDAISKKILGKRRLINNIIYFQNINFSGQTFSKHSKYSNIINQVRMLGMNKNINNYQLFEQKFKQFRKQQSKSFYWFIKKIQGSLQKIMILYRNFPQKNINLTYFINKYKVKGISQQIFQSPFNQLSIQYIVSIYQFIQKNIIQQTWQLLPKQYKQQSLNQQQKQIIVSFLEKSKQQKIYLTGKFPQLQQVIQAINRFVSRCLIFGQINSQTNLIDWLPQREDFWPFQYEDDKKRILRFQLPVLILKKIWSLHKFINNK